MQTIAQIDTKRKMYKLLERGALGNTVRMWPTIQAIKESGYDGMISMRSKQVSNPVRLYHVPMETLEREVAKLPYELKSHGLMFSESPDDAKRTIQGEITVNRYGIYLRYTTIGLPMRLAFDVESIEVWGLQAKILLKQNIWPTDYDELFELLEVYPDHIIEFSAFSVPVGKLPGKRMIIWECRTY